MKKVILIAIVFIAVAAIGFGWWKKQKTTDQDKQKKEVPQAVKVERGNLKVIVEATGRVVPDREVEIKCKASGEVITLPVDVSDLVKKGDLLVQLDPTDEKRSVQRAEYALSVSKAKLDQARLSLQIAERELETEGIRAKAAFKSAEAKYQEASAGLERTRQLAARKMASSEELDVARTVHDQANAELENARARIKDLDTEQIRIASRKQDVQIAEAQVGVDTIALDDARQRLDDTRVTAPIDGVVAQKNVQVGQIIASGVSNVGGGTSVMTLADLSHIFVLVSVDESDIGQIRTEQKVRITVDAYPDIIFRGQVVRVATKGANVSNVITFEVKVEVKGPRPELLKPEMTANVEITAADKKDVLLLPISAVQQRRGQRLVTVQKTDGTSEERPVTVGLNDGEYIEVEKGLSEGEVVLLPAGGRQGRWSAAGNDGKNGQGGRPRMRMMGGRPRR